MRLRIFELLAAFFCFAAAEGNTRLAPDEVVQRIAAGIHNRLMQFGDSSNGAYERITRAAFEGLDDAGKIQGLVEWMFRQENHSRTPAYATELLLHNHREIQDTSELRRLLIGETDSRRFYMLAEFSRFFESSANGSFVPERARGLLLQGRAADRGQSTVPEPMNDIAGYTYHAILADQREEDYPFRRSDFPDFEIPGKPIKEKCRDLAVWLKANWPGCEDLEIPPTSISVRSRGRSAQQAPDARASAPASREAPARGVSEKVVSSLNRPAIFFALELLAAAILWYFLRRK